MLNKYIVKIDDVEYIVYESSIFKALYELDKRLKPGYFCMPRKVVMNGAAQTKVWINRSWDRFLQYKVRHFE